MNPTSFTFYALTFVDLNGEEQFLSKRCEIVDWEAKPFFTSKKNAKAARTAAANRNSRLLPQRQQAVETIDENTTEYNCKYKHTDYENSKLIHDNGITIRTVTITFS